MAESSGPEHALRRVLWELREYLPDLVLIGGWVPFLYRCYGGFKEWRGRESLTTEVDLLTEQVLPTGGRVSVADRLQEAGFHPLDEARHAAVWIQDPEKGEKIEFFVSHEGTARARGGVRSIGEQPGLGGISLDGLWFMNEQRGSLTVLAQERGGKQLPVDVNVPQLGAFAVNKAVTFPQRSASAADSGESKQGKDLLYLHDLMGAGTEATERIEQEIEVFKAGSFESRDYLDRAVSNLRLLHGGQWTPALREATRMLVERGDASSEESAIANLRGYLDDFLDLLTGSGS